jgi:hypothetical protein
MIHEYIREGMNESIMQLGGRDMHALNRKSKFECREGGWVDLENSEDGRVSEIGKVSQRT